VKKEFWERNALKKKCAPTFPRELHQEVGVYVNLEELCYQKNVELDKNSKLSTCSPSNRWKLVTYVGVICGITEEL
jgi:hypothetical protein